MNPTVQALRQEMVDALGVLEALKPHEDTGWDKELFDEAWKAAQFDAERAMTAWLLARAQ